MTNEDLNIVPIQTTFLGSRRFVMAEQLKDFSGLYGAARGMTLEDFPDSPVPALTVKIYLEEDEGNEWKLRSGLGDEILTE